MKKVIIIGGGIGGLTSAIRLLNKGYKVTIIEKESTLGGKVNKIESKGARFDLTASIIMTPNIYTEVFKECNKDYTEYFSISKLDCIYNIYTYDKKNYKLYGDINKSIESLENIKEGLSDEYLEFLYKSNLKYIASERYFLSKPMVQLQEILNKNTIQSLLDIKPLKKSSNYISKIISNKDLRQIILFQTLYIGINPYKNSSIYTLIPAISQMYGLWYIKGGMYSYIEALEKLIKELGGEILLNTEVLEINGENKEVLTKKGIYKSDIIINNTDYPYSREKLFKSNEVNKELSCSVFMLYLGLNKKYRELEVNNIYINKNQEKNTNEIFSGHLAKNPDMYIYYPSKMDELISGSYASIMNIMIRVPNLKSNNIIWDDQTIKNYRNLIISQIKNIKGLENIDEDIEYESYLTPKYLSERFNSYYGNAFGISHKLTQTTYFRPHMIDKNIKDIYHIGSSTHPGNGVSVVIDGSKVLVEQILKKDGKK